MRKSRFCENESPVYISDKMTGKMAGIPAISTSCFDNLYCAASYEAGRGICKHCFSCKTQKRYKTLREALRENEYLKYHILKREELPIFQNIQIVRFEAFGDLETEIQFYNYYQIAKANKDVKFALWSKNAWLVDKAYKRWNLKDLPNLVLVYSSLELNTPAKKPEHFDKVFTVYEKGVLSGKEINCGARSCAKCKRCYTRRTGDQIRELLK